MKLWPYILCRSGLLDDAEGGLRELVAGKEDVLLEGPYKRIPRADVAEVCVQVYIHRRSF